MDIAAHIGNLVLEHECVIIPGLGAFLTNFHSSEIHPEQHSILPPSRKLVFNAQLNTNDGLLAHYLAQRLSVSYKTSLQLLGLFVTYCKRDLAAGKQISFGELGVLDLNSSHKLEFYPNTSVNYNEDAFGLKPLPLQVVERKHDFSSKAPLLTVAETVTPRPVIHLNKAILRKFAAVLIPLALLMGAVFYMPVLLHKGSIQETSFFSYFDSLRSSVFAEKEKRDDTPNIQPVVVDEVENGGVVKENAASNSAISDSNEAVEFIVQEPQKEELQGAYHIICGSFLEKERAQKMVNQLKSEGFPASLAGQSTTGTYRVSMQSFTKAQDANRQIKWVRHQGYDRAWILNKTF